MIPSFKEKERSGKPIPLLKAQRRMTARGFWNALGARQSLFFRGLLPILPVRGVHCSRILVEPPCRMSMKISSGPSICGSRRRKSSCGRRPPMIPCGGISSRTWTSCSARKTPMSSPSGQTGALAIWRWMRQTRPRHIPGSSERPQRPAWADWDLLRLTLAPPLESMPLKD